LLGAVIVFWCGLGAFTFWSLHGATILRANQSAPPLESSPKVSIIVAARKEQGVLPAVLESLLALDYPDY
jgi:cellulose synthase/poly-beta-1,6-N-acetylglucosamine synthase-like glycosyltransferase